MSVLMLSGRILGQKTSSAKHFTDSKVGILECRFRKKLEVSEFLTMTELRDCQGIRKEKYIVMRLSLPRASLEMSLVGSPFQKKHG